MHSSPADTFQEIVRW